MADINVLFKRGMQASLEAAQTIEGAFYLTKDTHRLYVGQGKNPVLLNQTVQFVNSIKDLMNKNGISCNCYGRIKHASSIYNKIVNKSEFIKYLILFKAKATGASIFL